MKSPAQPAGLDERMSRSVKALRGDAILARDGDLGFVVDAYFDDERWRVRYLVVDNRNVHYSNFG